MSSRRKKPRNITHDSFEGTQSLSCNDLKRVTVLEETNAAATLLPDWQEDPIALVALQLGLDNTKVANANLLLQGAIDIDPKKVEKLFSTEAQFSLNLERLDLKLFKFEGALVSQLLCSTTLQHTYKKQDGSLVSQEELSDACISGRNRLKGEKLGTGFFLS